MRKDVAPLLGEWDLHARELYPRIIDTLIPADLP
jgi:hypothetical protein